MFWSLISFVFIGILTKLHFGILGMSLIPSQWSRAIKKRDKLFFIIQVARLLIAFTYVFLILDVKLIDRTVGAYFQWFALPFALSLMIDGSLPILKAAGNFFKKRKARKRRRSDYYRADEETTSQKGVVTSCIPFVAGFLILLTWVYSDTVYNMTIKKAQYNSVSVKTVDVAKEIEKGNKNGDEKPKKPEVINNLEVMPIVTRSMASIKGDAVLANSNSIGNPSYFNEGSYQLTKIGNELSYTSPIEMAGLWKAGKAGTTPGYTKLSATNPNGNAKLVKADMKYVPSNYFSANLKRNIRKDFPNKVIFGTYLEPDEKGKPYFVVSVGHYKHHRTTPIVDGTILVDPTNGNKTFYPLTKEPKWVDKTFTVETALEYWKYWGRNKHGWKNQSMFGAKTDVLVPNEDNLQVTFNQKGEIIYVTDFVREKLQGSTKTLVGYGVFNAKTGEMTYYHGMDSVLTGKEALNSVNASEYLSKFKGWEGNNATFYTIYGQPTYVVPVVDGSEKFAGIAVVYANSNDTKIVFGKTKEEAFFNYQKLVASLNQGNNAVPQEGIKMQVVKGKVKKINDANYPNNYVFLLKIEGNNSIFSVNPELYPDVVLTEKGENVELKVLEITEDKVNPVQTFKNLNE